MKRFKQLISSPILQRSLASTLLALLCLFGYASAVSQTEEEYHTPLLWAFVVLYLILMLLLALFFRLTDKNEEKDSTEMLRAQIGSMNLGFIQSMPQPVLICDATGRITWFNHRFSDMSAGSPASTGASYESVLGVSLDTVVESGEGGEPYVLNWNERVFHLRVCPLVNRNRRLYVTLFEDRTAIEEAKREKWDETVLVAYIVIDNLEELTEYAQNRTRAAAAEVVLELEKWAEDLDGILKEYEREKFLLLFDQKHADALEEGRFDILDRIREIRVGEGGLPVTVSIGLSRVPGTPAKRAAASAACLDMALQRGGDQAVVRSEDGSLDFYGGKTKTTQKRTRVRARMMALNLLSQISASGDVLIMMHRFPDFDAIGAAFGILRLCSFCGVSARIIVGPGDPNFALCRAHLEGLADYRDESRFLSPAQAQDAIGPDTLLVIVDVNNRKEYEAPAVADMIPGSRTVIVDHHRKTAEFSEKPVIEYIEPSASSACELITEMIEQTMQPGILGKEEADLMYAGIMLDTKQFVRNTGVRTFSAALFLRGEGAIPSDAQALFKTDLPDFLSEAQYESAVSLYREHFAFAISEADGNDPGVRLAASKAADKLLSVSGIKASFALCPMGDGVRISARSDGEINVQRIMEHLGGGGHFDAAAAMLRSTTLPQAVDLLKEAIDN